MQNQNAVLQDVVYETLRAVLEHYQRMDADRLKSPDCYQKTIDADYLANRFAGINKTLKVLISVRHLRLLGSVLLGRVAVFLDIRASSYQRCGLVSAPHSRRQLSAAGRFAATVAGRCFASATPEFVPAPAAAGQPQS